MINIDVDRERCQRYAQCVVEAPELFQLDSEGELVYHATAEDDRLDAAEDAAEVCPMQAITVRAGEESEPGQTTPGDVVW